MGNSTHRIQILLLDCQTLRISYVEVNGNHVANPSPAATMLGNEQWAWLEQQLLKPATSRIVCSSTQFGAELNGWETWDNYPLEVQRMVNLIQETQAEHLIFMSGDVHYAELSKRDWNGLYPIYDFTSSGLTQIEESPRHNTNHIGNPILEPHAGMISIDWTNQKLIFEIFNVSGAKVYSHTVEYNELEF
ncbi:MAG: alkaline phosphatase D family protein [Flavobacteriales bacterium]|nr:alkaline phosphatase D family protein [Flavobacteriales bacterium]